tara:strand:+ start:42938 stop:43876 length:939 start_codon:yes stop_codon:yes gene_type:complete
VDFDLELKKFLDYSKFDSGLASVLTAISQGSILIQKKISRLSLENLEGSTGTKNIQNEDVKKLDILANNIFLEKFKESENVAMVGCEELENPETFNHSISNFLINMDPLDGSSNIDVGVNIGSIFGIWHAKENEKLSENSLLKAGREQIASAYVVYGSSTVMVIASQKGVQCFILDTQNNAFILSKSNITIPGKCKYYSVNYGNFQYFNTNIQNSIAKLQKTYSLRYIGSLVADFHRNLLEGGVFLYPKDSKNPNGKLRLMYEANPLSFIAERAGGIGTNGSNNILDIKPKTLHERIPLFIGNSNVIENILI